MTLEPDVCDKDITGHVSCDPGQSYILYIQSFFTFLLFTVKHGTDSRFDQQLDPRSFCESGIKTIL
jgi:hypothetical protein